MRRAALAAAVAALACASGACAYFNAMYNADRYAHLAQVNEREGRLADARADWQQAAAHAETLVVHHPKSGWVAKAQLLRGRALVRIGDYSGAQLALQAALRSRLSPAERLETLGLLGRVELYYHQLDSAGIALDSAAASRVPAVRDAALLDRGKVWIALGRPDSARAVLSRSRHPEAGFALAAVDVQLGDTAAAGAAYDSLAGSKRFDEAGWRPALDSLAAAGDRGHASRLVARLVARRDAPPGAAARLLLDEATRRLAAGDSAAAQAAWRRVRAVAGDSVEGQVAAVALARLAIAAAVADSDLDRPRRRLMELTRSGGGAGRDAALTLALLARVDSLGASGAAPDAHWFLRAELLRDSLGAVRLAAADFAAMATRFPASPWTPKGLVAAIAAGYPDADSVQGLLLHRYAGSPYVVAAAGGAVHGGALARLEDSLQTVLAYRPPAALGAAGLGGEPLGASEAIARPPLGAGAAGEELIAGARPPAAATPHPAAAPGEGGGGARADRAAIPSAVGSPRTRAAGVSGPRAPAPGVEWCGIPFQNRIVLAAGTAGFGVEVARVTAIATLGGLVTKAVSVEPRRGNPAPRVAETRGAMLNSIGLANPGLEHFRRVALPWLAVHLGRARLLVNVVGDAAEDFARVVRELGAESAITAFELNVSCPNVERGGMEFGADDAVLADLVRRARGETTKPLVVKLSPALPDPGRTAAAAVAAGADAFTAVNTLPARLYDEAGRPRLGAGNGGLSGPPLLPVGLRVTQQVAAGTGKPVIGTGGVRCGADALQYLDAGATLVGVGTAALADPRAPERIARELAALLERRAAAAGAEGEGAQAWRS